MCELELIGLELLLQEPDSLLLEGKLLPSDSELEGTRSFLDVVHVRTGCWNTRPVLDGDCVLVAGFRRVEKKGTRRSLLLLSRGPRL
jgi:hypothetical protein